MQRIAMISLITFAAFSCKKPASATASVQLQGTFKGPCLSAGAVYQIKTIVMISGNPVSITDDLFKDSGCTSLLQTTVQTPASVNIVVARGAGEVPESVDWTLKQALTTISDSAHLQALKAANTCGLANAQLSQQADVTSCFPPVFYDYWLTKADGTLTIGLIDAAHDGKSADHRPKEFDRGNVLHLVNQ